VAPGRGNDRHHARRVARSRTASGGARSPTSWPNGRSAIRRSTRAGPT
jgi:hypothetical protein